MADADGITAVENRCADDRLGWVAPTHAATHRIRLGYGLGSALPGRPLALSSTGLRTRQGRTPGLPFRGARRDRIGQKPGAGRDQAGESPLCRDMPYVRGRPRSAHGGSVRNGVPTDGCHVVEGLPLLYVGISPTAPPAVGGSGSRQAIRSRIR
jgi:hypothetical protein